MFGIKQVLVYILIKHVIIPECQILWLIFFGFSFLTVSIFRYKMFLISCCLPTVSQTIYYIMVLMAHLICSFLRNGGSLWVETWQYGKISLFLPEYELLWCSFGMFNGTVVPCGLQAYSLHIPLLKMDISSKEVFQNLWFWFSSCICIVGKSHCL